MSKFHFAAIGFTDNDQMLDAFNDHVKGGKPTTFAEWFDSRLIARKSKVLDHPGLPPVADDDLDDGDPSVAAKLKPRPSLPTLSAAIDPESEPEDRQLVLA